MRILTIAVALILVTSAATLRAADLAGNWTAKFMTDVGEQSYTFTFTSSGGQLTGTAKSNLLGDSKLTNVKVEGDKVSFVENGKFQDMDLAIAYTGTFSGNDTIDFTRVIADQFTEKFTATRAK
jgi:hypothetical protein